MSPALLAAAAVAAAVMACTALPAVTELCLWCIDALLAAPLAVLRCAGATSATAVPDTAAPSMLPGSSPAPGAASKPMWARDKRPVVPAMEPLTPAAAALKLSRTIAAAAAPLHLVSGNPSAAVAVAAAVGVLTVKLPLDLDTFPVSSLERFSCVALSAAVRALLSPVSTIEPSPPTALVLPFSAVLGVSAHDKGPAAASRLCGEPAVQTLRRDLIVLQANDVKSVDCTQVQPSEPVNSAHAAAL